MQNKSSTTGINKRLNLSWTCTVVHVFKTRVFTVYIVYILYIYTSILLCTYTREGGFSFGFAFQHSPFKHISNLVYTLWKPYDFEFTQLQSAELPSRLFASKLRSLLTITQLETRTPVYLSFFFALLLLLLLLLRMSTTNFFPIEIKESKNKVI